MGGLYATLYTSVYEYFMLQSREDVKHSIIRFLKRLSFDSSSALRFNLRDCYGQVLILIRQGDLVGITAVDSHPQRRACRSGRFNRFLIEFDPRFLGFYVNKVPNFRLRCSPVSLELCGDHDCLFRLVLTQCDVYIVSVNFLWDQTDSGARDRHQMPVSLLDVHRQTFSISSSPKERASEPRTETHI